MNLYSEQWKTLTASLGKQHSQQTGENENDVPHQTRYFEEGMDRYFSLESFAREKSHYFG